MEAKKIHEIKVKTLNYSIQLFFNSEETTFSVNLLFDTKTNSSDNLELWQKDNDALGKLMKEKLDPIAFHDSLIKNGDHCIFTCGCGKSSCAGFEPCTQVKSDDKNVMWLIKNRYYAEDIKLILDRVRSEEVLNGLIANLERLIKIYPQLRESVYCGKNIEEVIKLLKSKELHYNFKRSDQ